MHAIDMCGYSNQNILVKIMNPLYIQIIVWLLYTYFRLIQSYFHKAQWVHFNIRFVSHLLEISC